jgi:hypothetical protein
MNHFNIKRSKSKEPDHTTCEECSSASLYHCKMLTQSQEFEIIISNPL